MITRSDWQAVRDAMLADDRARLGEPPTVEELLAYEAGKLSKEDAERVQQLLVAYPELARAYVAPFPPEDEQLPDDVVERQWNALRGATRGAGARVLQFWRWSAAAAAALAIVFGAMLWQTHTASLQPHVLPEATVLTPDGSRGPAEPPPAVGSSGEAILLVVPIVGPTDYETYRLDLIRTPLHERVWSSGELRRPKSDSFNVEVPASARAPGLRR